MKSVDEPKRKLIFKDSIEFEMFVENGGVTNLKEKAGVFSKVKCISN